MPCWFKQAMDELEGFPIPFRLGWPGPGAGMPGPGRRRTWPRSTGRLNPQSGTPAAENPDELQLAAADLLCADSSRIRHGRHPSERWNPAEDTVAAAGDLVLRPPAGAVHPSQVRLCPSAGRTRGADRNVPETTISLDRARPVMAGRRGEGQHPFVSAQTAAASCAGHPRTADSQTNKCMAGISMG